MRTINLQIAMMSHLSDAEYIMTSDPKQARLHIEFVKLLMIRLSNDKLELEDRMTGEKDNTINGYISEEDLNDVWSDLMEREHNQT